jgi:glycosyltransferase involved in cell wall biosynthesis
MTPVVVLEVMANTKKVVVLTPTIGKKELAKACESVAAQTYPNLEHIVVTDGPQYVEEVSGVLATAKATPTRCNLPHNTGGEGYYGHRIIAGFSKLINADYITVLDEDNWIEPNHVETLVKTLEKHSLDFSYALRNYCSESGEFLVEDNCESIGSWEIQRGTFVDTNAYMYSHNFIRVFGQMWDQGWAADRDFFRTVALKISPKPSFMSTGYRTLNYRLANRSKELVQAFVDEVTEKNKIMEEKYEGKLPWLAK